MEEWVGYYERVFGMTEMIHFSDEAISTEYSALMSKVVTDGSGRAQVPDQRARRGQAQVADRGVHRVLQRRRRPAHRRGHPRHRGAALTQLRDAGRRVPDDPRLLLRRRARAHRRDRGGPGGPAAAGDPGGPGRRGLPAPDLHEAGRRPPDGVLRDHRATRLARLRRGQLQGSVRGDRARAGAERKPLAMRYASLGSIPAKRHVQVRSQRRAARRSWSRRSWATRASRATSRSCFTCSRPAGSTGWASFTPIEREEWVPDAHVHRLADANVVDPGGDPVSGRRLLMWNSDIEVSVCKPLEAHEGFYRNGEGDEVHLHPPRQRRAAHRLRPRAVPRARLRGDPARHDAHVRAADRRGAVLALLPHAG